MSAADTAQDLTDVATFLRPEGAPGRVEDAYSQAQRDYFTASDRMDVALLRARIQDLAAAILVLVPAGRQRSIALTELESVQMRANRGIFTP